MKKSNKKTIINVIEFILTVIVFSGIFYFSYNNGMGRFESAFFSMIFTIVIVMCINLIITKRKLSDLKIFKKDK